MLRLVYFLSPSFSILLHHSTGPWRLASDCTWKWSAVRYSTIVHMTLNTRSMIMVICNMSGMFTACFNSNINTTWNHSYDMSRVYCWHLLVVVWLDLVILSQTDYSRSKEGVNRVRPVNKAFGLCHYSLPNINFKHNK